ncbi:MAG: MATE family efflux transporter [Candidatus Bruticola sp.]
MPIQQPYHDSDGSQVENNATNKKLFEQMSPARAVTALSIPTILSQLITVLYNAADTYFIGQLNNHYMVAALSLTFPLFYSLNAIGNLFGLGGASVISRLLGSGKEAEVKHVSAFSFYTIIASALLYSLLSYLFLDQILYTLGAGSGTIEYARRYMFYVVVIGAVPTTINLGIANLLRSDGHAKQASFGLMLGGILNILLDPIFIFIFKMDVTGVAAATLISGLVSCAYFIFVMIRLRRQKCISMSLNPRYYRWQCFWPVVSIGASSAINTLLAGIGNFMIVRLSAQYGDVPIAAFGIVKKIEMLPINISMGVCQGYMPLVGYNYAAKNYRRMWDITKFAWICSLIFSVVCVVVSWLFSREIISLFIDHEATIELGAKFLRLASLGVPLTVINFLISYGLQAMSLGKASFILSAVRLGFFNIAITLLLDHYFGMFGVISGQPVAEVFSFIMSGAVYYVVLRRLMSRPGRLSN